jgi:hypothetical protein
MEAGVGRGWARPHAAAVHYVLVVGTQARALPSLEARVGREGPGTPRAVQSGDGDAPWCEQGRPKFGGRPLAIMDFVDFSTCAA